MDQNYEIWIEMYSFLNRQKQHIMCNEILQQNNILNKLNELITILEDNLREKCEHEIEEDYIDISEENYQKICYCTKCLLTFNTD
jgi:hypothetical protein